MKPCPNHEETLMLWAAGALTTEESETLQLHLEACEPCRNHAKRLESMCQRMAEPGREVRQLRVSEGFGQRLRERLAAEASSRPRAGITDLALVISAMRAWFRVPRLALAAGMIACLLLLIWVRPDNSGDPVPENEAAAIDPVPPVHQPVRSLSSRTLFAYQKALGESPEALDALVLRQARKDRGGEGMTLQSTASAQF